ncbi:hypothetical protein SAMN05421636_11151 [Pricia antarctica]|uniref:Uncharacterized protein n=1 Tax=Pricia antarctica TaxID=641691 RepID=A0A1G7I8C5_9FLAO|nr:hypothetical protein [Pricia antarctica]SDF08932.1 hypothetical protein SAMN05421636_11151 [Pricia antarctica]
MLHPNIPNQIQGGCHDTVSMHCTDNVDIAIDCYKKLQERLTSVNEWHTFSDKIKAEFALFDGKTQQPTSVVKKGNLIRIEVPGIGNPSGGGYDWTKIVAIQTGEAEQGAPFLLLSVRPCPAPKCTDGTVAHFYNGEASSTFIVRRVGTCIYAEVHGRNEIENTSTVPVMDTIRNKAVAIGSKLGIGNLNWLGFTQALLEPFKN